MNARISVENLAVLKDVHQKMVDLSLPNLNNEALKAIGKAEGIEFKKALVAINNNEDTLNHNRGYIISTTCLLSSSVIELLTSLKHNVPYEVLIKLGKDCGREFRQKLSDCARNDATAIEWVKQKIESYTGVATTQPPAQASASQSTQKPVNSNVANKPAPTNQDNVTNINRNMAPARNNQMPDHQPYPAPKKSSKELADASSADRQFFCVTFYGKSSALCFNATEKDGEFSMTVDGGMKKEGQAEGGREIDWKDKIIFGFSPEEMIELAWVLLGVQPSCKFSGHGVGHDKSFEFKRQEGGYFGSVTAKGKVARAVPLGKASGFRLMLLITRQILKNFPDMTVYEIILMLQKMGMTEPKRVASA